MSSTRLSESVERLGALVAGLEGCESVEAIYDHVVTAAEDVLAFDAAIVCTVEDGAFEPRAVNVRRLIPSEPLAVADGIAGKTYREDRTYVVDDLETDPDAAPSSGTYRSVLSIPLDDGVLQFHSRERAAFSTADRHLGELLAAAVANVRGRVAYETALGCERDRFAALFENVPDAALQYRVDDGIQRVDAVNAAFIRTFGYDADEAVGEPIADLLVPDDDRAEPELIDGPAGERRTELEVVRETAAGSRTFLLRNVPVTSGDDATRGYLIYTDLTELKVRERELERKNERLDRFASIVSHDLRNPLNVADGYLELAMERHPCEELEAVRRAHDRMERLVEDVLALAREGGRLRDLEPIDLETVAERAWRNVSTEAATLEVDADARVEADRTRLLQLFENLFRNAIEHAGPSVRVRVERLPDGFAVADDGPGVPPDERETVFETGYTTETDNTGFGLAIVRQIARAHGWTVEVTDAAGGGTRFEFTERDDDPDRSDGLSEAAE